MNPGILVIDSADNRLEPLLSRLASEHLAGRSRRVMHKQDFVDQLQNGQWDMVLINEETGSIRADECRAIVEHRGLDTLTVLVCMAQPDSRDLETCLRMGIEGPLSIAMEDFSVSCIRKLLAQLKTRRRLDELETANAELESRSLGLLDSTRDAVAYLHQGMHVYANAVYCGMFGFQDEETMISTPFIDLVDSNQTHRVREILSTRANAGSRGEETYLTMRTGEGRNFGVAMKFMPISYEGESCLQIVIACAPDKGLASLPEPSVVDSIPAEPVPELKEGGELPAPQQLMLYFRPVVAVADIETECLDIVYGSDSEKNGSGSLCKRIAESATADRYDTQAIQTVLDVQTGLYKRGQSLQFMLALSAPSLLKTGIAEELQALFYKRGLDAGTMIIRVRQKDVADNLEHAEVIFTRLRGCGFRLCIDEYHPDAAIDTFMRKVRVHFCRIDGQVVPEAIDGIVDSLHENRVRVIAGDVDTSERLSRYWEAGIDLIQGSYFQPALQAFSMEAVSDHLGIIKDAV